MFKVMCHYTYASAYGRTVVLNRPQQRPVYSQSPLPSAGIEHSLALLGLEGCCSLGLLPCSSRSIWPSSQPSPSSRSLERMRIQNLRTDASSMMRQRKAEVTDYQMVLLCTWMAMLIRQHPFMAKIHRDFHDSPAALVPTVMMRSEQTSFWSLQVSVS